MLNELPGVLNSNALPKQRGDKENKEEPQPKNPTEEEEEEEEELYEGEKLVRKKHDKELDSLLHLCQELEDKEKKANIAKLTLETQKSLFPTWTMDRIQKQAIDALNIYLLEPSKGISISML
ncbi:unnamed protein product [Lactuca saligna]|uniref:Uncharacterized protein n=1 Tax=Lactuca saligna TaxID=75948 RepID=A0AA35ZY18_LACSI|nr:unnamed protein product [Lactuca saligna]